MRKQLRALTLVLILSTAAFAALPSTTTWELRNAGSNNNGACYVTGSTGTDFSQQNAAQYTFTDLVLPLATTATSLSHSFIATDVGNCMHITAGTGFTAGFYQILSVSAGTATLDRSAGTAASTGGTYAVGGAAQTPTTVNAAATAGNRVYVKADGTYTLTAALSVALDSSRLTPYRWTGYTTTRTDNGRATWTTATNSINLIETSGTSNNVEFDNFSFTTTAGTKGDVFHARSVNGFSWMALNCIMDGFKHGVNGDFTVDFLFSPFTLVNSEIKNSTSDGVINDGPDIILGSYIHDNAGNGVFRTAGGAGNNDGPDVYAYSIFKSNTSSGVSLVYASNTRPGIVALQNVFMSNGADGMRVDATGSTTTWSLSYQNNIFYSNTGWGVNYISGNAPPVSAYSNAFGANGSGTSNNIQAGIGDVSLTANPFTSSATNDFSLNPTAGGGAVAKGAGYPGVLTVGGTGHLDIGALQSAGGGGSPAQINTATAN